MFVLDSNVLIDAANRASDFHEPCRRTIERCRTHASPWYISWPICYEFLRVSTHPHVFPKPLSLSIAWQFVETLLSSPSAAVLVPTNHHPELLSEIVAETPYLRGNILHDVHTAVLMREHGIRRIYTRDLDFHRFPFIKVIDPAS